MKNIVARCTVEAKLRSMANGVSELVWLKLLLEELEISMRSPMTHCDNKAPLASFIILCIMIGLNIWRLTDTLSKKN